MENLIELSKKNSISYYTNLDGSIKDYAKVDIFVSIEDGTEYQIKRTPNCFNPYHMITSTNAKRVNIYGNNTKGWSNSLLEKTKFYSDTQKFENALNRIQKMKITNIRFN